MHPMANVRELMTSDPLTLTPDSKVLDALRMMNQVVIRHVPVVGDGGKVVGILSDRDLRNFELANWAKDVTSEKVVEYLNQPVSEVMSDALVSIAPDASMKDAIGKMLDESISALPVVENDQLVGIVTTVDILYAVQKSS